MAAAVYYEARGEADAGMRAVGSVVMNRVRRRGGTACSVVYERSRTGCQFSWVCHGRRSPSGESWDRARSVAAAVVGGQAGDASRGATFFSRCGHRPAGNLRSTARIGHHCFWTEPPEARETRTYDARRQARMDREGQAVEVAEMPPTRRKTRRHR